MTTNVRQSGGIPCAERDPGQGRRREETHRRSIYGLDRQFGCGNQDQHDGQGVTAGVPLSRAGQEQGCSQDKDRQSGNAAKIDRGGMAARPAKGAPGRGNTAVQGIFQEDAARPDQEIADVAPSRIILRLSQRHGPVRHGNLVPAGPAGDFFHRISVAAPGGKIHFPVDSRRILAQHRLDQADLLEHLLPLQTAQVAQAVDGVGDRDLVGRQPVSFLLQYFLERHIQLAFEPTLQRHEGRGFVRQMPHQPDREMGGRVGVFPCQFGQGKEQRIRAVPGRGQQAVGPEIGLLLLVLAIVDAQAQTAQAFQQPEAEN